MADGDPTDRGPDSAAPQGGFSPRAADAAAHESDPFADRPELFVGGAFVGGLVLAGLIRVLGR